MSETPAGPTGPHGDFGVYVHVPYCLKECPYCDFPKFAVDAWPEEEYVEALLRELEYYAQVMPFGIGWVRSVYFGGGTPSLFAPESFAAVIRKIRQLWPTRFDLEITLEANPRTLTVEKLRGYRKIGVNRLSVGVQSFRNEVLALLGRDHDARDAVQALLWAQECGFDAVNVDIIYCVPGDGTWRVESDVQTAVRFGATHISAYVLTYKPGTPFFRLKEDGKLAPMSERDEAMLFDYLSAILREKFGFEHYEVSNFAQPGYRSRHNLSYWHALPYVGVGAGAAGYAYPGGKHGFGWRWKNAQWPPRYLELVRSNGCAHAWREDLTREQARLEFCMVGLRCVDGIDRRRYRERFGEDPEEEMPLLHELAEKGLLRPDAEAWRVTQAGLRVADSLALALA